MNLQLLNLRTCNCIVCYGKPCEWHGHVLAEALGGGDEPVWITAGLCLLHEYHPSDDDGCFGPWRREMGVTI